jgi:hypothetical protein
MQNQASPMLFWLHFIYDGSGLYLSKDKYVSRSSWKEFMPMIEASRWWSRRKFSIVSLMLSLAYATIMGWAFVSVQMSKQPPTPHIENQIDTAWLVGGLASFGFAVAALVADSDRKVAIFAMIVAVMVCLICGVPIMVSA